MAQEFTLLTDSSCDLPAAYLAEHGIISMQLSFTMNGETYQCNELDPKEFYARIRAGEMPITAQVSVKQATDFFEPLLQEGKDILYIAFSSGLSGTYSSGHVAAQELGEKYPERKIIAIDSLCASLGQGLLVHKAVQLRGAGKTIEEVAQWVRENLQRVTHYVAADDLMHLHRGGRVSKASAVMGSVLGIKPIIFLNEAGKLIVIDKARGRANALNAIVNHAAKAVSDTENDICFICHADCEEDAKRLSELITKRFGVKEFLIHYIGPVIGAHTGPGTLAAFMMGKHR